jgi:transcriptional regulator with XRE-family HTH domain
MNMEFGEYLKSLRKRRGFSIRKLAHNAGVSNSYLSQIETGQRGIPSPWILRKLARPLKVEYEELLRAAGYLFVQEKGISAAGQHIFRDEDYEYSREPKLDLEELLQRPKIKFKGVLLSEEDKKELIEFLEFAWGVMQKKKKQGKP